MKMIGLINILFTFAFGYLSVRLRAEVSSTSEVGDFTETSILEGLSIST